MHTKTVVILLAAAIAAGTAALLVNRERASSSTSGALPALLFPELKSKINDVTEIEIKRAGESFSIKRAGGGGGGDWGLASKSGFPVQIEQVKGTIVGVANLKPIEAKTSRPDLYAKIGVQDPSDAPAPAPAPSANLDEPPPTQPTLVTLKDSAGTTLAAVIVGTQKWGNTPSVFVRKAGDKQSWLAEAGGGRLEVPTEAMQWIERQVLNIGRERVKSVSIVHPADGSEVEAWRDKSADPAFTVKDVPAGRELTSASAPESLITGPQYLSVDDVAPIDQVSFSEPGAIAVFRTFDGLVVTARTVKKDAKDWVNLTFAFEEPPPAPAAEPPKEGEPPKPPAPAVKPGDEVKKEVTELTDKLAKWAFAIPEYKAKSFNSKIDDLLKPLTPPTPAGAPAVPEAFSPAGPFPVPPPDKPGDN